MSGYRAGNLSTKPPRQLSRLAIICTCIYMHCTHMTCCMYNVYVETNLEQIHETEYIPSSVASGVTVSLKA